MSEERLYNLSLKDYTLEVWRGKLGYPLNQKDIEELEHIIDYYEQENQQLKESYCNRTDCSGRLHDSRKYPSVKQQLDLYKSVLDEIREKIEFTKVTIEYGGDCSDVGYNFLISADKIVEILDKVRE